MRVYAITGLPGSGKTHRRLNDPKLRDLPAVDVQDAYRGRPGISTREAYRVAFDRLYRHACEDEDVVLEGIMLRKMYGRDAVKRWARKWRIHVTWIDIATPVDLCRERILADGGDRMQVRLELLEKLKEWPRRSR